MVIKKVRMGHKERLDGLRKRMNQATIDFLSDNIKQQKKFRWVHYLLIVSAIILTPLYFYTGNYFSGSVWLFNFFLNGYFIHISKVRVNKLKKERLDLLKETNEQQYNNIVRRKKFESLGIK